MTETMSIQEYVKKIIPRGGIDTTLEGAIGLTVEFCLAWPVLKELEVKGLIKIIVDFEDRGIYYGNGHGYPAAYCASIDAVGYVYVRWPEGYSEPVAVLADLQNLFKREREVNKQRELSFFEVTE